MGRNDRLVTPTAWPPRPGLDHASARPDGLLTSPPIRQTSSGSCKRLSGITVVGTALAMGTVVTIVTVIGGAVIEYWSPRTGQLLVAFWVLVVALVVAALLRRRTLRRRRKERFAEATHSAADSLAADGASAWVAENAARRQLPNPVPGNPGVLHPVPREDGQPHRLAFPHIDVAFVRTLRPLTAESSRKRTTQRILSSGE